MGRDSRDLKNVGVMSAADASNLLGRQVKAAIGLGFRVTASTAGLGFESPQGFARLSWSDITALEVMDASRYTATRLVTLGLAGGLSMKKQRAIVAIGTVSNGTFALTYPRMSAAELMAVVEGWKSKRPDEIRPSGRSSSPTVRDRLTELEGLKADGLVTEAEYEERRRRILDEL